MPNDILIAVNVNADISVEKPPVEKTETAVTQSIYHKKIKDFYNQFRTTLPSGLRDEKIGYFNLVNKTLNLMTYQLTEMTLEKYPPDILVNISRDCCGIFDFYKAEEMVEAGRRATIKTLEAYKSGKKQKPRFSPGPCQS